MRLPVIFLSLRHEVLALLLLGSIEQLIRFGALTQVIELLSGLLHTDCLKEDIRVVPAL